MDIQIITPQFDRIDGQVVTSKPSTVEEFNALRAMDEAQLKALGCGIWSKEDGVTHWLFPKEWYDTIPNGLMVDVISGRTEAFVAGVTDNDYRFGCLAYGFKQNVK